MALQNLNYNPAVFDHQAGLEAMFIFIEEAVILIVTIISVPALIYTMEKLLKKKLYHPLPVLLSYVIFFYIYFDILQEFMQMYL